MTAKLITSTKKPGRYNLGLVLSDTAYYSRTVPVYVQVQIANQLCVHTTMLLLSKWSSLAGSGTGTGTSTLLAKRNIIDKNRRKN